MKKYLFLLVFVCTEVVGQTVSLLKDINTSVISYGTEFSYIYETNNNGVFFVCYGLKGTELYKCDDTGNNILLLKDINPNGGSYPQILTYINGVLYFTADDGVHGRELWKTDGTSNGTVMIKDINPYGDTNIYEFITFNNKLFFVSKWYYRGDDMGVELLCSDGTEQGTNVVKDIGLGNISATSSFPQSLTIFNGFLFFSAGDSDIYLNFGFHTNYNRELWKTDGTEQGTVKVKEIKAGTGNEGDSYPEKFAVFNGYLYFTADNGINGNELWRSNGTEQGTVLFKEFTDGIEGTIFSKLVALPNSLIFSIKNSSLQYAQLWKSNGTFATTTFISNKWLDAGGVVAGNNVYFRNSNYYDPNDGFTWWQSDGTSNGTVLAPYPYVIGSYMPFNNSVLYLKPDGFLTTGQANMSLFKYDGQGETKLLDNTGLNSFDSYSYNTKSYFSLKGDLYKTDGTSIGTLPLVLGSNIVPSRTNTSDPVFSLSINNLLYFNANDGLNGNQLWKTDGTTSGTALVKIIPPHNIINFNADPNNFYNHSDSLYFTAYNGLKLNGGSLRDLWKSGGTEQSTVLFENNTTDRPSMPFASLGNKLFLTDGLSIKVRSGTASMVISTDGFYPEYGKNSIQFTNNAIFFMSYTKLAKSNGLTVSTLKDNLKQNSNFIEFNGAVYFLATTSNTYITGLWKTDGTVQGTQMIKNVAFNDNEYLKLSKSGNYLVFFGTNKIYRSDGTDLGTIEIANYSNTLYNINTDNNKIFFFTTTTVEGIIRTIDINGNILQTLTIPLTVFVSGIIKKGDNFYISKTNCHGYSCYNYSGSLLAIGSDNILRNLKNFDGYSPSQLVEFNDKILFTADDGFSGKEIWVITPPCPSTLSITENFTITPNPSLKKASVSITATNQITGNGTNVTYQAGNKVELNAGFKADNGTVFISQIGGCN